MNYIFLIFVSFITSMIPRNSSAEMQKSPFMFNETVQGIELTENGKPVFFYQRKPKSLDGKYICTDYIHPLYSLSGDTLTEEFPPDHPYHRGIFWSWHQLYIDDKSLGDGWTNEGISQDVINVITRKSQEEAQIDLDVLWKSSTFQDGKPFLREHTTITVHEIEANIRKIDFEIVLRPLVKGFQIGGSPDEKGYGGFCARLKLSDDLIFTSENGPVKPRELQIKAGPWMDFSGRFGNDKKVSGITILCNPSTPNYPEPWILRQKGSMQNSVFPGQKRLSIPMDQQVVLRYRIIVHNGNAENSNISALQKDYEKMSGKN
jgi:hypothetical protein